ncbi:MAG: hypothetical protein KKH99_10025 [Proteobacteria bacterium]|nr:hypothetical protein [Pseudomonadota bacterium]
MKSVICTAACLLMLLSLNACVSSSTETDPRKGGLFGYNPKAYEKRIEERKAILADTESDTQSAKLESRKLDETLLPGVPVLRSPRAARARMSSIKPLGCAASTRASAGNGVRRDAS